MATAPEAIEELPKSLGSDLRAVRQSRGMTLEEMAVALGRSVGWVSQVERNLSVPRLSDVQAMAKALDAPLSIFFGAHQTPEPEAGRIVRAKGRRTIGVADGLAESLLSPDLTDTFEVVHSTFAPGARRDAPMTRPTTEVGYVVSGKLDLWIGATLFHLNAGDSFRLRGEPLRWANPYREPAELIWVISPPVY